MIQQYWQLDHAGRWRLVRRRTETEGASWREVTAEYDRSLVDIPDEWKRGHVMRYYPRPRYETRDDRIRRLLAEIEALL